MRGKEVLRLLDGSTVGITPAHAGKRAATFSEVKFNEDHPRTCGEKFNRQYIQSQTQGSPPHMRGKGTAGSILLMRVRITPAHAGKSLPRRLCRRWQRDHPRTCGEKCACAVSRVPGAGSPPHMRGKGCGMVALERSGRITPAHAGKRRCVGLAIIAGEDHPRTCGEKGEQFYTSDGDSGSPPHMRGKGKPEHRGPEHVGITPAHAGKSMRLMS